MIYAVERIGQLPLCTEGDPDEERQCDGYDWPHDDGWCRWCHDARGDITDECCRPGIMLLAAAKKVLEGA